MRVGLFAALCACIVAIEIWVVFIDRTGTFAIEGLRPLPLVDFARQYPIAQAFYMRGNGLHAVRVRFDSDVPATIAVEWTLWRGLPDVLPMTRADGNVARIKVGGNKSWTTFETARDGSSADRWYTLELRLVGVDAEVAGTSPVPTVLATEDNPDRGGALWVNNVRQRGSMVLRADRIERTLYRRFLQEAVPNLPALLQPRWLHWIAAVLLHAAFIQWAYAMLFPHPRIDNPN